MKKFLFFSLILLSINVLAQQTDSLFMTKVDSVMDIYIDYLTKSDTALAEKTFLDFIQKYPNKALPYNMLGTHYLTVTKDYDKAENYFLKAIGIDSTFVVSYNNLGVLYLNKGDYDKALEYYKKGFEIQPDSVRYGIMTGALYLINDDYQNAQKYFNKALSNEKYKGYAYFYLAQTYNQLDSLEKAYDYIKKATHLEKNKDDFWYLRASIEVELEKYLDAVKSLDSAIKIKPKETSYYLDKNRILNYINRTEQANWFLIRSLQTNPDTSIYFAIAENYFTLNDLDSAIFILQQALEKYPNNPEIFSYISDVYRKKHDYAKAYEYAKKATEIRPLYFFYWEQVAYSVFAQNTDPNVFAKEYSFKDLNVKNLNHIIKLTKKKSSPYYFKTLQKKYQNNWRKMSFDELFMLYVGNQIYDPSEPDEQELQDIATLMNNGDFANAYIKSLKSIENNPYFNGCYIYAAYSCVHLKDCDPEEYFVKYLGFMYAILMTGNGYSTDSAFIVTSVHDEYEVAEFLGYPKNYFVAQKLIIDKDKHFDVLTFFDPDTGGLINIYYNIDLGLSRKKRLFKKKK